MLSLPQNLIFKLKKFAALRYGENPHQKSAFYVVDDDPGYKQLLGIELSHNNLGDANHAWQLVCEFEEPTVAIIKHGNPSGIATNSNLKKAFKLAFEADSVSAFGGIIAVNRPPTVEMIEAMHGIFFELLVAPDFSSEVFSRLKKRSSKMRVITAKKFPKKLELTRVFNGYLVQTPDDILESKSKWEVKSGNKPSLEQFEDMEFAWKVVKHVKSNAIVIVKNKNMLGMGTGQPNRVNSVRLALRQAQGSPRGFTLKGKLKVPGAVLASDAFFPFADNVKVAALAGISVIIQPGGSINDEKVINEAKKHRMTMVFTGIRHFKH